MAEVQTHTESGEMTQRFIEFVMMQAQNAAFMLGQIPHPQTGKGEVNLDMAKMFIDQLAMIRAKTKGNLSNDELAVLNNAISNLQMAFYEVSQGKGGTAGEPESLAQTEDGSPVEPDVPEDTAPTPETQQTPPPAPAAGEGESKKKFSKSYGA